MRLQTLLLLSHLVSASLAAIAMALASRADAWLTAQAVATGVGALLAVVVSWLVGAKLKRGLRLMIQATAKTDRASIINSGILEFDGTGRQLSEYVQRWSEAAAGARQQTHDVEMLLLQLDRRSQQKDSRPSSAGVQLRHVLDGITRNVDVELHQVLNCAKEIWHAVGEIADGADDQSDSVTKTTTYVNQISTHIEAVAQNARNVQGAVAMVQEVAKESTAGVADLIRGVERLGNHLEANERSLRTLTDRSHEISAMIETIGGIASRTDMLALNASIESVRAGEHGKGFAIVAEEVHRLAEQTAHATREVSAMLDSTQLETRESIRDIAAERQEIERDLERVQSVQDVIERVIEMSHDSADRLGEIPSCTEQQLLMIQEVLLAFERIANVAKSTRSQAEKARWTTKALSKMTTQFDSALAPLRVCADGATKTALVAPVPADTRIAGEDRDQAAHLAAPEQETSHEELEVALVR